MVFAQQTQWVFPQETYRVFMLYYLFSFFLRIKRFYCLTDVKTMKEKTNFPKEDWLSGFSKFSLLSKLSDYNLVFVLLATKVTIVRFPYNVIDSCHLIRLCAFKSVVTSSMLQSSGIE